MPCDYSKYPPNWRTEIRPRILERANHRCEFCGVDNYAPLPKGKVVLIIAHLDHDETNWGVADERLAALCQRCHLRYDAPEKARRRAEKKATQLIS